MKEIILDSYDFVCQNFESFVRGEVKGIINLPVPVCNIDEWYGNRLSPYAVLLRMSQKDMEKIIYYSSYVALNQEDDSYKLISEAEKNELQNDNNLKIMIGTEAIIEMLGKLNPKKLNQEYEAARAIERHCMAELERIEEETKVSEDMVNEINLTTFTTTEYNEDEDEEQEETEFDKIRYKLREARMTIDAVGYFKKYGTSRLIVKEIQLFPLLTRTILKENAGCIPYSVYHDIANLSARVASRANRIKRLVKLNAPEIILRNEKRILQESVDSLFNNGKRGCLVTITDEAHALASLADINKLYF